MALWRCSLTNKIVYVVAWGYLKLCHHYHCVYLVVTKWCLNVSSGIHWVMPQGIIREWRVMKWPCDERLSMVILLWQVLLYPLVNINTMTLSMMYKSTLNALLCIFQVATFILQKILLDEHGLSYICQTYERFSHVAMILVSHRIMSWLLSRHIIINNWPCPVTALILT